jgi:hypothetical protein
MTAPINNNGPSNIQPLNYVDPNAAATTTTQLDIKQQAQQAAQTQQAVSNKDSSLANPASRRDLTRVNNKI